LASLGFHLEFENDVCVLKLQSEDGTNRLGLNVVFSLTSAIRDLKKNARALIISGNEKFFSVGADLVEIAALNGLSAREFSQAGQSLGGEIQDFPAPVYAAIAGYCMGGGLDVALACHYRIASPGAVFGHRGAALGLITGWGGTQRLPRLIGKSLALQMFVAAEKVSARHAFEIGLIDAIANDPIVAALNSIAAREGG
jgi:enoyl-CoA hydratase